MTIKRHVFGWVILILGMANISVAQGYRGITPMHSTCDDVKRILTVNSCDQTSESYDVNSETIKIAFSKDKCEKVFGRYWNIPKGTVVSIQRLLKQPIPLSDLTIDISTYEMSQTDVSNEVIYMSKEVGMSLWVYDGKARSIMYGPKSTDENLLCDDPFVGQSDQGRITLPSRWYDRYSRLTFSDEKKRLDYLAKELRTRPQNTKICIVVYSDARIGENAARKRVERAQNYLTSTHAITPSRVKIVDGGKRNEFEVVIFVLPFDSTTCCW